MTSTAEHTPTLATLVFYASNLGIVVGYLLVPPFALRLLPMTRLAKLLGTGFFIGCAGSHAGMIFDHSHLATSPWWALWHLIQLVCTWGFILEFGRMLVAAKNLRLANPSLDPELEGDNRGGRSTP